MTGAGQTTAAGGRGGRRGLFVVIEGIDQSGKQTQVERLQAWLRSAGYPACIFAFPAYDTPVGRLLGDFLAGRVELGLEARHLLYAANRWEVQPQIEATLTAGAVVVVDRFSGSGLAYGRAQGLDPDWLAGLERGLPVPDLVALLDLPPEVAFARKRRARDRYESRLELLSQARAAYRWLAERDGWLVLDATQPADTIAAALRSAVTARLAAEGGPAARVEP